MFFLLTLAVDEDKPILRFFGQDTEAKTIGASPLLDEMMMTHVKQFQMLRFTNA